jgi:hypothetical protein
MYLSVVATVTLVLSKNDSLKWQSAVKTITKHPPHPCFGEKLRDRAGEM